LNDLSDQGFSFFSPYSKELYLFDDKISFFSKIFSFASAGLLIFSILLIMNFISTSVTIRKKEIGILRALGARTADVVKIFNAEGLFIATLIASINIILLIFGIRLIENVFSTALAAPAIYLSLTFIHIAVVLAVSFLVVLLSSIIPVKRVGRMKPVDAIRKIS
jgi:ABC-type antimicrobial peptide transport system permease subunit